MLIAVPVHMEQLDKLESALVRIPFKFESKLPIIGYLRQLWNDVSAKWYVDHAVRQQIVFDTQLVENLKQIVNQMESKEFMLTQHITRLEQQLSELQRLHELDMKALTLPVEQKQ